MLHTSLPNGREKYKLGTYRAFLLKAPAIVWDLKTTVFLFRPFRLLIEKAGAAGFEKTAARTGKVTEPGPIEDFFTCDETGVFPAFHNDTRRVDIGNLEAC